MPSQRELANIEHAGFGALCSEDSRFTWRDGVVLIGGAIVSWGLSVMEKSKVLSEAEDPVKAFAKELEEKSSIRGGLEGIAMRAMKIGLTADEVAALGNMVSFLPGTNQDRPEIAEALKRVAKWDLKDNYAKQVVAALPYWITEKELIDLSEIPPEAIEANVLTFDDPKSRGVYKIDWEKTGEKVERFKRLPVEALKQIGFEPSRWFQIGEQASANPKSFRAFAKLFSGVKSDPIRKTLENLKDEFVVGASYPENFPSGLESPSTQKILKAASIGLLQKIDDAIAESPTPVYDNEDYGLEQLQDLIDDTLENINKIGPWSTLQELESQLNEIRKQGVRPVADEEKSTKRRIDRLAQENPEWAISEHRSEYERGVRVGPVLGEVANYIRDLTQKGEEVVIHGRDGELIYKIAERTPGVDMRQVHYAITSRPLTSSNRGDLPPKYKAYLERVIPKNAVHIDTGYQGSVPKWLDARGFPVKAIRMVSATKKEEEIPLPFERDKSFRDSVVADLEHSAQRLESPQKEGFEFLTYSSDAPGFWARYYGVLDALKLPRLKESQKTRFESQQRFKTETVEPVLQVRKELMPTVGELLSKKKKKGKKISGKTLLELIGTKTQPKPQFKPSKVK